LLIQVTFNRKDMKSIEKGRRSLKQFKDLEPKVSQSSIKGGRGVDPFPPPPPYNPKTN
jgi:hypothetical protein